MGTSSRLRRPRVVDYVRSNHEIFLSAIYSILRHWNERGQPKTGETSHSFRSWSRVMDWMSRIISDFLDYSKATRKLASEQSVLICPFCEISSFCYRMKTISSRTRFELRIWQKNVLRKTFEYPVFPSPWRTIRTSGTWPWVKSSKAQWARKMS